MMTLVVEVSAALSNYMQRREQMVEDFVTSTGSRSNLVGTVDGMVPANFDVSTAQPMNCGTAVRKLLGQVCKKFVTLNHGVCKEEWKNHLVKPVRV
jgi:hypothetical protein